MTELDDYRERNIAATEASTQRLLDVLDVSLKARGRPPGQRNAPGHGAGRPTLSDEPTERYSLTAPASLWRLLESLGDGNRSKGLRVLAVAMLNTDNKNNNQQ